MTSRRIAVLLIAFALACSDDSSSAEADTDAMEETSSAGDPSVTSTSNNPAATGETGDDDPSTSGGENPTDPTADADPSDPTTDPSGGGEAESDSGEPSGPQIPEVQGTCPEFPLGTLDSPAQLSFPVGSGSRQAQVYFDPAQGGGGPLVFFYYGGGGNPGQAVATVTSVAIEDVVSRGGMVVAPLSDPAAGNLEWFLVGNNGLQNDLVMQDSIVACADAGPGIDPYQIHGIGFSAGGLHVAISSILRSSYMASTVVYSGGVYNAGTPADSDATPSSLIFHGGASDNVAGLPFDQSSMAYANAIESGGGYALLCNHNTGHGYPANVEGQWRRADAYNFLLDHPWGATPLPYPDSGVPDWVPPYCDG